MEAAAPRIEDFKHGRVPRDVRRRQLVELAEELFAERGYAGASMEELCRRAGVTKPVVYDLFGSLADLLEALLEREEQRALAQLAERARAIVRQVPSSDPEKLRYLAEIGLVPGAEVELLERYPFGGGLRLRVGPGGQERIVGQDLATAIGVACVPAAEGGETVARAQPDNPPGVGA